LLVTFYLALNDIVTSVFPYELLHPHECPTAEGEMPGTSLCN